MTNWHELGVTDVLAALTTDAAQGLSEADARERLARHGPNQLVERGLKGPWAILREQLTAMMMVILMVAALLSALIGDMKDAVVILVIIVLNASLGFHQEYRAEQALAALKRLAVPMVRLRRGGHLRLCPSHELVPGDIVLLEAGNYVPADCRLIESANLRIQEAALTGESVPVDKDIRALDGASQALGDRRNMAYRGTVVTYGRGTGAVVATGMQTELGRIAEMLQAVGQEPTPLQRRLEHVGRWLAAAALAIVAVVFVLGLVRGERVQLMLLTAIGLAVAAVPEGLPAVVTIALSLGAQRMLKRRALIRKLAAVETLGSVTVICSDKTGTLTENRMTVTILDVAGHRLDLTERLRHGQPIPASAQETAPGTEHHPAISLLLAAGTLCNEAVLEPHPDRPGDLHAIGDPTEVAIVVAAAHLGLPKAALDAACPRIGEVPFDSSRKRMTTVHRLADGQGPSQPAVPAPVRSLLARQRSQAIAFTKGAVGGLLERSAQVWVTDHLEPMTEEWRARIVAANDRLAGDGVRVLSVAFRPLDAVPTAERMEETEQALTFIGLIGMLDPPRPEVKEAVRTCRAAGIRPVMITGDHPLTAQSIARQLGMDGEGRVLTGQELEHLSVEALERQVETVSVYARVSPEHKLKIVQALQRRGHIVAMTGDGVNDAPALKQSEIGVAMGIAGTDVAKEAADMVLLDDNFATIVSAVEEGRVIYDNIRKFLKYLLTTNSAEIWVMLAAPFLGMPLPLLPLQLLWINLVTDGLPALALGVEPAEPRVMQRPPAPPNESIFARGLGRHVIWVGLLMASLSLGAGFGSWRTGSTTWQTLLFTTLAFAQMAHVMVIRSERESLLRLGLWSNRPLVAAVTLTVVLQLAVVYLPLLQAVFHTHALSLTELALAGVLSLVVIAAVEAEKLGYRARRDECVSPGRASFKTP